MDYARARYNMVEQQIRTWEVLDQKVLDVLESAPRHEYVPAGYEALAYADIMIPIGEGQVMMAPKIEARLLQALTLAPGDRVLEVGTGTGYLASLLARLAREVVSVEISPRLADGARAALARHGVGNVTVETGDAAAGREAGAPYDAIALTGSVPVLEDHWKRQLGVGGRLFVVVGEPPAMEARLTRRTGESEWTTDSLFETVLPALLGVRQPERFVF